MKQGRACAAPTKVHPGPTLRCVFNGTRSGWGRWFTLSFRGLCPKSLLQVCSPRLIRHGERFHHPPNPLPGRKGEVLDMGDTPIPPSSRYIGMNFSALRLLGQGGAPVQMVHPAPSPSQRPCCWSRPRGDASNTRKTLKMPGWYTEAGPAAAFWAVSGKARSILDSMNLFVAFGAGVASFVAPCMLAIVPAFLAYLAGFTLSDSPEGGLATSRIAIFLNTLVFVIGFTTVFVLLGSSLRALSQVVRTNTVWLN
ncbi:MAG: hypothetical protein EXR55_04395 [Dehalococcoidia bacterium]|nr:hypothetical protein [Dehalococcoidia bacterium]